MPANKPSDPLLRYSNLQVELERKQQELNRSEGARQQLLSQLQQAFGLKDLEEARTYLPDLEQHIGSLEEQLAILVEELQQEFGSRLEEA